MLGSKKTSDEPTTYVGRYGAIKHILDGNIPIQDVLVAAQQLQAARGEPVQPVEGSKPPQPAKPVAAFDLKRTLSRPTAGPPIDEPWQDQATAGPADLIRHFCVAAITQHWPELTHYDEQSYRLVMDVAAFAVNAALRLAGVSENWIGEYRELTAGLRR